MKIKHWIVGLILLFPLSIMAQEKELTLQDLIPGGKNYAKFQPENLSVTWVGDDMYLIQEGKDSYRGAKPGHYPEIRVSRTALNKALKWDPDFVQAQNALLKTIEEPPSYGVILLLTANQDSFLPTILSRCVQLKCRPVGDEAGKRYLMEKLDISEEKAEICSAFARGNIGKMMDL